MRSIIFDLDLTLVDTTCLEKARHMRDWRKVYCMIPQTTLYEGMDQVFAFIRQYGIRTAIVSTAPHTYVQKLVDFHDIPADVIVGYHDAKPIKPHPAPMLKAAELLGESPENIISFGDRTIDMEASRKAGIFSAACFWGTKEFKSLESSCYDIALYNPEDIISLIY